MQLRSGIPLVLALAAFGCGAEQRLTAPTSGGLRATNVALPADAGAGEAGAVYTMTNAVAGNAVLAFPRAADGSLGAPQSFATGGAGTGAGLGNQGALELDEAGRWLFVVNAGSNDVSVFRTTSSGLALADRVSSGGERPISLAVRGDLLYVLNAGGAGGVQGFRVSPAGTLQTIAGAARPLDSVGPGPAQIGFAPDGTHLVVSEKGTNTLAVYAVAPDGSLSAPVAHASSGATPFGFGFDHRGTLVVSEAFGGAVNGSAVSSYRVGRDGALTSVSPSVPTHQTAACWIAVSRDNAFAYTANAGSASISGYAIAADGTLTALSGAPAATGTAPTELAFNAGSRFLYVLNGGAHSIGGYAVQADGSLTPLPALGGLVASANGLAAR